jgi:hypothetical protein
MSDDKVDGAARERRVNVEQLIEQLVSTVCRLEPQRYYFNLTDGVELIPDTDGIELLDLFAAQIYAQKAIEELRQEDPRSAEEWRDWRLEIVDARGNHLETIYLDARKATSLSLH